MNPVLLKKAQSLYKKAIQTGYVKSKWFQNMTEKMRSLGYDLETNTLSDNISPVKQVILDRVVEEFNSSKVNTMTGAKRAERKRIDTYMERYPELNRIQARRLNNLFKSDIYNQMIETFSWMSYKEIWDFRTHKVTPAKLEKIFEEVSKEENSTLQQMKFREMIIKL